MRRTSSILMPDYSNRTESLRPMTETTAFREFRGTLGWPLRRYVDRASPVHISHKHGPLRWTVNHACKTVPLLLCTGNFQSHVAMCRRLHTHRDTKADTHTHTRARACTDTYTDAYAYAYTYTYTRTHTHTFTHLHLLCKTTERDANSKLVSDAN